MRKLSNANEAKKEMNAKSHDEVIKKSFQPKEKKYRAQCLAQTQNSHHPQKRTGHNSISCNFIIDTYAWIEYFKASKMGETTKQYAESERSVTPTIVISELAANWRKTLKLGMKQSSDARNA